MENLDSWVIFGKSYSDNCCETENLVNRTFSVEFCALFPQKPIIGTQWLTNEHVNVLFTLKHSFRVFPILKFYSYSLSGLVAFLPSGSLWQPSMSKESTSIPECLLILITNCSRFSSETLFQFLIFDFHLFILKLLVAKGAQPQIFQGRGGLVGLGHFINILLKTPEKNAPQGKI